MSVLCQIYSYSTVFSADIVDYKCGGLLALLIVPLIATIFREGFGEGLSLVMKSGLTNIYVVNVAHFTNTGNFLAS